MLKGRKFKKAESEFAQRSKSFDTFCAENNIEPIREKHKNIKRNIWISVSAVAAAAVIVVCGCIPLMKKTESGPAKYYGDKDVWYGSCELSDIYSQNIIVFDTTKVEEYSGTFSIISKENDTVFGYIVSSVLYYSDEYLFEFDYTVRTDKRYRFKDLDLYNGCAENYIADGVSYNYGFAEGKLYTNAYITYEIDDYDYFIRLYETDYTTELNKDSIQSFIKIAFGGE